MHDEYMSRQTRIFWNADTSVFNRVETTYPVNRDFVYLKPMDRLRVRDFFKGTNDYHLIKCHANDFPETISLSSVIYLESE